MSSINENARRVLLNNPGYGILPKFEHELAPACLSVRRSILEQAENTGVPAVKRGRNVS